MGKYSVTSLLVLGPRTRMQVCYVTLCFCMIILPFTMLCVTWYHVINMLLYNCDTCYLILCFLMLCDMLPGIILYGTLLWYVILCYMLCDNILKVLWYYYCRFSQALVAINKELYSHNISNIYSTVYNVQQTHSFI